MKQQVVCIEKAEVLLQKGGTAARVTFMPAAFEAKEGEEPAAPEFVVNSQNGAFEILITDLSKAAAYQVGKPYTIDIDVFSQQG